MTQHVLTLNVGSSSIKFAAYEATDPENPALHLRGEVGDIQSSPHLETRSDSGEKLARIEFGEGTGKQTHGDMLGRVCDWLESHFGTLDDISAVAHRVVHDGGQYEGPTLIEPGVLECLAKLNALAPKHQPQNLEGIRLVAERYPDLPQVASFDTTFHRTMPWVEQTFALPSRYFDKGLRRFGFHGLSYEYIMHALPQHFPRAVQAKVIVAHLGHGASVCAIDGGKSIATTMGLTALDGLPMGQRCGRLDPGLVPYLIAEEGRSVSDILDLIYERSGLLGVSGLSSDMRVLLDSDEEAARRAVELFVHAARKEIGGLAACLEGLDALVFTGGIGANSSEIRARVCKGLEWLGTIVDNAANEAGAADISRDDSRVRVFALRTDEEFILARDALRRVAWPVN